MRYVLGVDGGNTKTDYVLCDEHGSVAAYLRAGTCSRENLGYAGAQAEMNRQLTRLFEKANISVSDVAYSMMGLAGVDNTEQQQRMTELITELGVSRLLVTNDSFLGIKAASETGVGLCSINGTEMSTGGVDRNGKTMQIGGLRAISGDDAGGTRLAEMALNACYDQVYRFGEKTAMLAPMLALLGCDAEGLHSAIGGKFPAAVLPLSVTRVLFQAAEEGDAPARRILCHAADTLARSAAGCALRLELPRPVPIILAGSVWIKGKNPLMLREFTERFTRYSALPCSLIPLSQPPVAGAVLWACELARIPVSREQVLAAVQQAEP